MPITPQFASDLWALILTNWNLMEIGSDGLKGATVAGSFYLSLHTGAPTTQSSDEVGWTGYARQPLSRSSAAFQPTGPYQFSNVAIISFGAAGSGPTTITHVGLGTAGVGAGYLLGYAVLANPVIVGQGSEVRILPGELDLTFAPCP